ncbi:MAG: CpaF family protein [Vulcanibacillus sp.]
MINDKEINLLKEEVRDNLDLSSFTSDEELRLFIEERVFKYSEKRILTIPEKVYTVERIYNSLRAYDVLQPLINDTSITEIMINSANEIFIEREGIISRAEIQFENQDKLEDIIQAIVSKVNRVVNESSPIVDARLKDGSRVNIVLPPIALKGPTMTIRKFPEKALTMKDLIEKETITEEAAEFIRKLVISKYNIFISGGTGSGKTTFLNILSNYIPSNERVITIEDSAELQIKNIPNLVSMETRNANTEGKGEVTISDLIRTSLRMRPNRIIVGEVRGKEALDMLQAMNTGHEGSISTGHANSTVDMLSRLETMVLSGANLPIEVIRKQINSAIDIMIHLARIRDNSRKIVEISEIVNVDNNEFIINSIYDFVEGKLIPTGNKLKNVSKLKTEGFRGEDVNE